MQAQANDGAVMNRWLPTSAHLEVLETSFSMCRYPDPVMRSMLATQLGIKQRQVHVWFQNRRQKEKKSSGSGGKMGSPKMAVEQPSEKPGSPVSEKNSASLEEGAAAPPDYMGAPSM